VWHFDSLLNSRVDALITRHSSQTKRIEIVVTDRFVSHILDQEDRNWSHIAFILKTFKALNGLLCADVPLRNYSLTISYRYSVILLFFFLNVKIGCCWNSIYRTIYYALCASNLLLVHYVCTNCCCCLHVCLLTFVLMIAIEFFDE